MKSVATVLVCASIYLCAYFALLEPQQLWELACFTINEPYRRVPEFRVGGEHAKTFFAPLLWLDRKARPTYWSGIKLFDGRSVSPEEGQRFEQEQMRAYFDAMSRAPSESATAQRAEAGSR